MAKMKVSEDELNKRSDPSLHDIPDIKFLKKYLQGITIDQLSKEYNISRGIAQIRINDSIQKLIERHKINLPDRRLITDCLNHKTFWLGHVINYELGVRLYKDNYLFTYFIEYFKRQSKERKEVIVKQLNELL